MFEFVRNMNANMEYGTAAWELLKEFDVGLGLGIGEKKKIAAPAEVMQLAHDREKARKAKDWKRADALRAEIKSRGYQVDDTAEGPRVKAL